MLRVGREAVVRFPNFGQRSHREAIAAGRMPVSKTLPYQWYNTPNVRFFSIADFEDFCRSHGVRILERIVMRNGSAVSFLPNLLGSLAVYRFERACEQ